ncbi:MAG: trehalase family glycosidase [Acidimicrobiales bacterium]|nr:trehalase family glycosidase [Acidimicrobiales bacterium]
MDELAGEAIRVLRTNDRGTWTRPSPLLYPHQWSWDAAFVAIGWAYLAPDRAVAELRSLFRGQWSDGMVPQIVFDGSVALGAYEPRQRTWATARLCPSGVATSGICQPPMHAIALARVRAITERHHPGALAAVDEAVSDLYPRVAAWHRWLHTERDPGRTGLVTIFHPWESGLDNSPRWDAALAAVAILEETSGERPDLAHVADASERPTDDDYRRYHTLVRELVDVDYDQGRAHRTHPFRMADVLFTAILAAADDALADLAETAGRPEAAEGHRADAEHGRRGLDACWDPARGACLDRDLIADRWSTADTSAGFAPLVAGCGPDRAATLVRRLTGPSYAGARSLRWAVPPSTAVDDPAVDPPAYWRGPSWPVITWLLWWALERDGHRAPADAIRDAAVAQLRASGCSEYAEALTGEPLGSNAQSWTAAVTLDWLAHEPGKPEPPSPLATPRPTSAP